MRRIRKPFIILIAVGTALILLYWVKCVSGVDLVKSWHLGDYLPVQVLQGPGRDRFYTRNSVPKIIINDGFRVELFTRDPWGQLWMRDQGKIHRAFVNKGGSGSRCLLIKSQSPKDWAYQTSIVIEVLPGDTFYFEGLVKTTGGAQASMCVILYDAHRKVIDWHFAQEKTESRDWTRLTRSFNVPEGGHFIRFRLVGSGIGESYFDDVRFMRLSANEEKRR